MTVVEFGELPQPLARSARVDWLAVAHALRDRPDEWARVARKRSALDAHVCASYIRRGDYKGFLPRGSYQAEVRGGDVWARYVGAQS